MEKTKSQIGKASRQAGARFELKVRADLESKGWIVDRWSNNVEPTVQIKDWGGEGIIFKGKLVPAKSNRFGLRNTGFPDFVIFRDLTYSPIGVIGVECKINGYLNQKEKAKCRWYLDNKVFSKILIASKSKQRGKVEYLEFKKGKIK